MQLDTIRTSLDSCGYYYGNIFDFIDDQEKYKEVAKTIREDLWPKEFAAGCYSFVNSIEVANGGVNSYESMLKPHQIQERKDLIAQTGLKVTQQWHWFGGSVLDWFSEHVIEKLAFYLYPDLNSDNIGHEHRLTLYKDGDFVEDHLDSANNNRKCAILLYLSEEKDYNDGGGRLLIRKDSPDSEQDYVTPLCPFFSIMDMEKHNVWHGVEPVRNNFHRFAYLDFVNMKSQ